MPGEGDATLVTDDRPNPSHNNERVSPSEVGKTAASSGSTESETVPLTKDDMENCKFDMEGEESKGTDVKPTLYSMLRVFRYATLLDWFLMSLGSLAAVVHGFILPSSLILLSFVIDAFVFHEASLIIATTEAEVPLAFLIKLAAPGIGVSGGSRGGLCEFPNAPEIISSTETDFRRSVVNRAPSTLLVNFTNVTGGTVNCSADYTYMISYPYNIEFTFNIDEVIKECITVRAQCYENSSFTLYLNHLVFSFVGIALLSVFLGSVQVLLFQMASERQVKKIRLSYFRSVLRQDRSWHDLQATGGVSNRLTEDITTIHHGIGANVVIMIQWVSTFFAGLAAGFYKNWELTLLLMLMMPFMVIPAGIFNRLAATFVAVEQKHYASAGSIAEEVLSAIRTVVAFGGEKKETARYDRHLKAAKKVGTRRGLAGGISLFIVNFTLFASFAFAFWFGIYLVIEGRAIGGDIVAVFFAVLLGAFYLGQSTSNFASLMTAAVSAKTIFDTIDRKSEIDPESERGDTFEFLKPSVEFKDVTFAYPSRPDIPVLTGFNLSISAGQRVAVVGPSGSGKSTLVSLIQRFYDIAAGQLLIGGHNVKELNVQWLRSKIGTVSQEPVLFNKTIAENIRHGNEDASMEEIKEAAKQANAHNFISHLPLGYNTIVGEQGTMLSGGQRQRVTIARALVRNPAILLLDEATSALDSDNEFILQDAIKHASKERTVILITHRLSLVQCADVVISMDAGEVIWQGTPSQLLNKKGIQRDKNRHADLFALHKKRRSSVYDKTKTLSLRRLSLRRYGAFEDHQYTNVEIFKRLVFGMMNKKERINVALGLLGCVISGSAFPCFAILFGGVFESFVQPLDRVQEFVNPWAGGFLVLAFWAGLGALLKTLFFSVGGEILTKRIRRQAFSTMLRQEVGWFDNEDNATGGLVTMLSDDARNIQGAAGAHLGVFVEGATAILLAHVISFVFNWSLTLILTIAVPLYIFSGWLHVKASLGFVLLRRKALQEATEIALEGTENIQVVTSLGLQKKLYREYEVKVSKPVRCALALTLLYGVSQGVLLLGYIIAFRYGAYQVVLPANHLVHSNFVEIFKVFGAMVFASISIGLSSSTFAPNYAAAKVAAQRIFTLLDRMPQPDGYSTDGLKLEKVRGELSLSQVYFRYPSRPEIKVIRDLSLAVNPGQTLALLGPSGSGKSTIFSLIERFYDPVAGTLSLDGKDFKDLNIRWLRSLIGIVSQEPVLFDISIADNIRYGANAREVSDGEVVEAAKSANIHNFIMSLPQGYSTNVGSKGTQLSGGQRQRVAVARVLLQDPPILLLDEATAALDGKNEAVVQAALELVQRGRTSVVITHKLATIRNADYIAVLSNGRLVEVGTHDELLARKGEYHRMVCLQQF